MPRSSILCLFLFFLSIAATAVAKPINPCASSATTEGGVLLVCPLGDGPTLADIGATIDVTVMIGPSEDPEPYPSYGMLPSDIWVAPVGSQRSALLCGGSFSCDADGLLDENGHTTISGSIAAGGHSENPVHVIAIGQAVGRGEQCDDPLPLVLVSPDINGDLVVDLVDVAMFGLEFGRAVPDPRMDFDGDGAVDMADVGRFAIHLSHGCEN